MPNKKEKIITSNLGKKLKSFLLRNPGGMSVTLLNYGATITKIEVPDRDGKIADVVLGHDNLSNYIGGRFYFGATIGRFANRIAGAKFNLDGKEYRVAANKNGNLLHGGQKGFDKKFWGAEEIEIAENPALEFTLISHDGEEGFPGNLNVKVVYTLTDNDELKLEYIATTDKPTIINMTNHAYFNLTGSEKNSILDHTLKINADKYTPIDKFSIPIGEIASVSDTPMDFRNPVKIGTRINEKFDQLENAKGYDHNWILNKFNGDIREAATVYEPMTGRRLEVFTDQPGIQFYTGNYLDGTLKGKGGIYYQSRTGFCLECQHFPNSPNEKNFPSVALLPGEFYKQSAIYKFSVI